MQYDNIYVNHNCLIYTDPLPQIVVDTEKQYILRVAIDKQVYDEHYNQIKTGQYLEDTSITNLLFMRGIINRILDNAIEELRIDDVDRKYKLINISAYTLSDKAVFSEEVVPTYGKHKRIARFQNNLVIDQQDFKLVRYFDYNLNKI